MGRLFVLQLTSLPLTQYNQSYSGKFEFFIDLRLTLGSVFFLIQESLKVFLESKSYFFPDPE